MKYAYQYLLLRFMPHREGGEFINVGVVVLCEALEYFGCKIDGRRVYPRVKSLFPNFERKIFNDGLNYMKEVIDFKQKNLSPKNCFIPLSSLTEGMFFYSNIRVLFDEQMPEEVVENLYDRYVLANYLEQAKSLEERITHEVRSWIRPYPWGKSYRKKTFVDNEGYDLQIPFVAFELKAAKPICFDTQNTRMLIDKITLWKDRLSRLKPMMPAQFFLIYTLPKDSKHCQKIMQFLEFSKQEWQTTPLPANHKEEIIDHLAIA